MTTSERFEPTRLYVWVWLPDADLPVVAGALNRAGRMFAGQEVLTFTYARSYRERPEAISLFSAELPLPPDGAPGTFDPTRPDDVASRSTGARPTRRMIVKRRSPLPMHGCLRDAGPDAWGRRVINLRLLADADAEVSELSYLAASSSDRIGALDFQASPSSYLPRGKRRRWRICCGPLSWSRRGTTCRQSLPLPRCTAPPSGALAPRHCSTTTAGR